MIQKAIAAHPEFSEAQVLIKVDEEPSMQGNGQYIYVHVHSTSDPEPDAQPLVKFNNGCANATWDRACEAEIETE